jgi:predicted DNA-binding transcriptional regulator YafY
MITVINKKSLLEIVYTHYSGELSIRQVESYRLLLKRAHWYLIAFCLSKHEFMVFKLSRISRLEILDNTFERRDCDLEALSLTGKIELEVKSILKKRGKSVSPLIKPLCVNRPRFIFSQICASVHDAFFLLLIVNRPPFLMR